MSDRPFKVLSIDLDTGQSKVINFGLLSEYLGGSTLTAALYREFGDVKLPASDPRQPIIFAIGALTAYFPLMSKVVCAFRSPYTKEWAESHAGGRLALALRFSGYDAIMIFGRAKTLSCLVIGSHKVEIKDVHYLKGQDVWATGKYLRRFAKESSGHRSMLRIGIAGEKEVPFACVNVDSYRHFGRLGAGAVLGAKKIKGILIQGDQAFDLPQNPVYPKLYDKIYNLLTNTDMMLKYHNLGTPENLVGLNKLSALPWRNLQATQDPEVDKVSGETFAKELLIRQTACSGCPIGCIHIGLLRQQFARQKEFLYRQVSYDYEPIFAQGTMLGITSASDILALLDVTEKVGLDCMSAGVALAWATEATQKGLISKQETLVPLEFGQVEGYEQALYHLAKRSNDFYSLLGEGSLVAAKEYGGEDFACVLGQEMAGYATGPASFVAQALGFRHSHLDSGGYSFDQTDNKKDVDNTVKFLMSDELSRVGLTSMVSCLFARKAYTAEHLSECLEAVDLAKVAENYQTAAANGQKLRWQLKISTGFDPYQAKIPKRYSEITTWQGKIDQTYMENLRKAYANSILDLAAVE